MATYLVEQYSAGLDVRLRATVDAAASELAGDGVDVVYIQSLFLLGDDTCFHLFQAASVEAVGEVTSRARLTPDRIVEVVLL